ncbi:hypothetical protein DEJ31_09685 [Curtobacterium sp. MCPF17_031]|nr:hypothetical protein DEJ31_09685 [Curtobacterium sp. MCPF17_031]
MTVGVAPILRAAADAPASRSVHTATGARLWAPESPPASAPASSLSPRTTTVPDRSVRYATVPAAASIRRALGVGCP